MSTPTTSPTAPPADLLPAQIADALQALAKRDDVAIHVRSHRGQDVHYHVVETRLVSRDPIAHDSRSGVGSDYAAALSACRAAEFGKGAS